MTRDEFLVESTRARVLRSIGMSVADIARRLHLTERGVRSLLTDPPKPTPPAKRPRWSYPDRELLHLVRSYRADMQAAERRKASP